MQADRFPLSLPPPDIMDMPDFILEHFSIISLLVRDTTQDIKKNKHVRKC